LSYADLVMRRVNESRFRFGLSTLDSSLSNSDSGRSSFEMFSRCFRDSIFVSGQNFADDAGWTTIGNLLVPAIHREDHLIMIHAEQVQ
jgi:hypothetical protein